MANHLSRRDLMRGVLAGAVSLAFTPAASVQLGPPPGVITLRYNEKSLWSQPRCPESCSGSCCPGRLLPGGDRDRSSQSDCPPERAQTRKHGPFIRIERGPAGSARGLGQERQNSASRTDLFRSSGLRAAHGCRIGAGTAQEKICRSTSRRLRRPWTIRSASFTSATRIIRPA